MQITPVTSVTIPSIKRLALSIHPAYSLGAMSQVKLTLRPPPNVDFVHGYPGIPPGAPDRPQATVQGALEVRAPPQGVKAKWVRVELRRVETLPGGGQSNTFFEFVGPSPVNLWTSSDEYSMLTSHDFPFQIRIPESAPPSLALENRAGVKYELVASVCTKGKRSFFFRRRKSQVSSTLTSIIIDKHELHSTWPVYRQPESRVVTQNGVTLTVERSQTCYGPGDVVSVVAILKSDSLHTIVLRGFEMTLKESTIFRSAPYGTGGKKVTPQVRVAIISDSKFPINTELYGGTVHRTELTCQISQNHTTTTLNAARHIDITYVLTVKAVIDNGSVTSMDLPVVLSNWQENVSIEAIQRIGPSPALSLLPPSQTSPSSGASSGHSRQVTIHIERNPSVQEKISFTQKSTIPSNVTAPLTRLGFDEFGYTVGSGRPSEANTAPVDRGKLSVTNVVKKPAVTVTPTTRTTPSEWATAEEEKFYEARARAEETQKAAARGESPPFDRRTSPSPVATQSNTGPAITTVVPPGPRLSPPITTVIAAPSPKAWLSAEEEKSRLLFNQAKEAVMRHQDIADSGPSESRQTRSDSNMSKTNNLYPSAEQEKAQVRAYEEAQRKVQRATGAVIPNSNGSGSSKVAPSDLTVNGLRGPVAYDALYPEPSPGVDRGEGSQRGSTPVFPPPFDMHSPVDPAIPEKERMRRAFEARDRAAAAQQRPIYQEQDAGTPPYAPPAFDSPAISEKERLRRRFVEQETQFRAAGNLPSPPPRPIPIPPVNGNGPRVMTAAEEKALLKAKFDMEDGGTPPRGSASTYSSAEVSEPQTPPPLMPRPPAEYIKETQEEDMRVAKIAFGNGSLPITEPISALEPIKFPGPPPPLPPKPLEDI